MGILGTVSIIEKFIKAIFYVNYYNVSYIGKNNARRTSTINPLKALQVA